MKEREGVREEVGNKSTLASKTIFCRFSIAVCNQEGNTSWTTDCASSHAANNIEKM